MGANDTPETTKNPQTLFADESLLKTQSAKAWLAMVELTRQFDLTGMGTIRHFSGPLGAMKNMLGLISNHDISYNQEQQIVSGGKTWILSRKDPSRQNEVKLAAGPNAPTHEVLVFDANSGTVSFRGYETDGPTPLGKPDPGQNEEVTRNATAYEAELIVQSDSDNWSANLTGRNERWINETYPEPALAKYTGQWKQYKTTGGVRLARTGKDEIKITERPPETTRIPDVISS